MTGQLKYWAVLGHGRQPPSGPCSLRLLFPVLSNIHTCNTYIRKYHPQIPHEVAWALTPTSKKFLTWVPLSDLEACPELKWHRQSESFHTNCLERRLPRLTHHPGCCTSLSSRLPAQNKTKTVGENNIKRTTPRNRRSCAPASPLTVLTRPCFLPRSFLKYCLRGHRIVSPKH